MGVKTLISHHKRRTLVTLNILFFVEQENAWDFHCAEWERETRRKCVSLTEMRETWQVCILYHTSTALLEERPFAYQWRMKNRAVRNPKRFNRLSQNFMWVISRWYQPKCQNSKRLPQRTFSWKPRVVKKTSSFLDTMPDSLTNFYTFDSHDRCTPR